ncbi:MAG: flagellin N-terminal helical domain-containing protein [Pararhizobium sp.]
MSNSILTNTSAMAALQTLRSINQQLDSTQNQISSGLRVGSASDNAAYWSIATTMKSDNQALSAVSDSLGLGASTVDVAYTALNSTITTLNDIKSRLVSAQQPGVDKSKIQSEITSLQQTIKSTADSANFSGSNFLSIDSSKGTTQSVVASFTRDSSGAITLGTIGIDTSKTALFDSSATGSGLLEKSLGNTSAAGVAAADVAGAVTTAATHGTAAISNALSYDSGAAGDKLTLSIAVDGGTAQTVDVTADASGNVTQAEVFNQINQMFANNQLSGFSASMDGSGNIVLTSDSLGANSSVTLSATTSGTLAATTVGTTDVTGAKTETAGVAEVGNASTTDWAGFSSVTLDSNDTISFDVAVDGGAAKNITINRATIDQVLGASAKGKIASSTEMSQVLNKALVGSGVYTTESAGTITLTTATGKTGSASSLTISNVKASGGANDFDLMGLDITNATTAQIGDYINGVDKMIQSVTTAASDLGATKTQITNQSDFLSSLMNSIDSGIGTLVDADMNEASTKLKALQTQQQLGIQALSIANSNSQNILQLFR